MWYLEIIWHFVSNICVKHLIDLLESVQRNFSKRIPSLSSLPYSERLAILNLDTLELRRLRFDLILYYKVFNHLTPFDPSLVFTTYIPPPGLRSNRPTLVKPTKLSNKALSTAFYRTIDAWNFLPTELQLSPSLNTFKRNVKDIDLSSFLKGTANVFWYLHCLISPLFLIVFSLRFYSNCLVVCFIFLYVFRVTR